MHHLTIILLHQFRPKSPCWTHMHRRFKSGREQAFRSKRMSHCRHRRDQLPVVVSSTRILPQRVRISMHPTASDAKQLCRSFLTGTSKTTNFSVRCCQMVVVLALEEPFQSIDSI